MVGIILDFVNCIRGFSLISLPRVAGRQMSKVRRYCRSESDGSSKQSGSKQTLTGATKEDKEEFGEVQRYSESSYEGMECRYRESMSTSGHPHELCEH